MCRNMTAIIYMCTFGKCKNIYNTESFMYYILTYNLHTCVSYHINIMMTHIYIIILTNVIFEYAICIIHKNLYVLLKTIIMYTLHINCCSCKWHKQT